jgi:hypothetical protein
LSYAELDRAANWLANALLQRRGPRHEPVALLLGQGNDAVIATLAAAERPRDGNGTMATGNVGRFQRMSI